MSELGDMRRKFTRMLPELMNYAFSNGYELALDYGKRCLDCKVGRVNSLHKLGLAVDFNLYKNGIYLKKTEDHLPLGQFWESIGGSWGGRFDDGNHYSLAYKGMR